MTHIGDTEGFASIMKRVRSRSPEEWAEIERQNAAERKRVANEWWEERHARRRAVLPSALEDAGVPLRIRQAVAAHDGFDGATPRFLLDAAKRAASGGSFYLYGEGGCGKSHLAAVALWRRTENLIAAEVVGESVEVPDYFYRENVGELTDSDDSALRRVHRVGKWLPWNELLRSLRDDAKEGRSDSVESAARAAWLVLDDISSVAKFTAFAVDSFREVIEARYDSCLPTIITSNLSPAAMGVMLGRAVQREGFSEAEATQLCDPIVSRILGLCDGGKNVIELSGTDRRVSS